MMVRKALTLAMVASVLAVTACNTVHGMGKDAKSAGNAVENVVK